MFNSRWLNTDDYEQLRSWWLIYGWMPPTKEMLPDNGCCGIMISKNNENICAGFIYFTNSKIAWCEYIISNNEYKEKDKKPALKLLINAITEICKAQGFKIVFTSLESKSLIKIFKECDFNVGDQNVTQLIKNL